MLSFDWERQPANYDCSPPVLKRNMRYRLCPMVTYSTRYDYLWMHICIVYTFTGERRGSSEVPYALWNTLLFATQACPGEWDGNWFIQKVELSNTTRKEWITTNKCQRYAWNIKFHMVICQFPFLASWFFYTCLSATTDRHIILQIQSALRRQVSVPIDLFPGSRSRTCLKYQARLKSVPHFGSMPCSFPPPLSETTHDKLLPPGSGESLTRMGWEEVPAWCFSLSSLVMLLFALKSCPHFFHVLTKKTYYYASCLLHCRYLNRCWSCSIFTLIRTGLQRNFISICRNWPSSSPWDCSSVLSNTMGSSFGTWCNTMLGRSAARDVAHMVQQTRCASFVCAIGLVD